MNKLTSLVAAVGACLAVGALAGPASATPSDLDAPQVNIDNIHFVPGSTLSNSTTSPSTSLKFAWQQYDDSNVCNDAVTVSEYVNGSYYVVASSNGSVRTTMTFAGVLNHDYSIEVQATDCSANRNTSDDYNYSGAYIDQEAKVTFSAGWTSGRCACFSGGQSFYSAKPGASASYQYTGNSVALITEKASNRGTAKVYLDGVFKQNINLRSAHPISRFVSFTSYVPGYKKHTMKIVVTSGRIDVEAFLRAF